MVQTFGILSTKNVASSTSSSTTKKDSIGQLLHEKLEQISKKILKLTNSLDTLPAFVYDYVYCCIEKAREQDDNMSYDKFVCIKILMGKVTCI